MQLSKDQLKTAMPFASSKSIEDFLPCLNETMEKFFIDTLTRQSMFLPQVAHESGCLRYTLEINAGHAYDVGKLAATLGNTPEDDGDGEMYKGRGLIQITGKKNYKALSDYFGVDFIANPKLLEGPLWASMSAGWFWYIKSLNSYADMPVTWRKNRTLKDGSIVAYDKFEWITYLINGGQNGIKDRLAYYDFAKKALGI